MSSILFARCDLAKTDTTIMKLNKTNIHIWYIVHKTALLIAIPIVILGTALGLWMVLHKDPPYVSPVPVSVSSQLDFVVIYPKGRDIKEDSWEYITAEETLSYTVNIGDNPVVFTLQKVPLVYADDAAAYDRFIGSLKPSINFKVPLGTVSIVNFISAGDFKPEGKSGILKSNGTLLIAHPEKDLTDNQWQNLFKSLTLNKQEN